MCIFSTLIIWDITLQCLDIIWSINFLPLLSLSLHSSSPTFKLLSMDSYGGELVLNSSSPWNGVSNHLSSFSIPLTLIHQESNDFIDEEDPRPTSSTWSYIMWYQSIFVLVMLFCFLYLFVQSIHFNSFFFILFSMYLLHCLVFWCCLE